MLLDIFECEHSFGHVAVKVYQSPFVGGFSRDIVNDIESEVELVFIVEVDRHEVSVFVLGRVDEL